jgi:hydrogenase maturation protein HypF
LLPYTPLHHLLMTQVGRPLVMTSGNVSEEPLAYRNEEALQQLGSIADLFSCTTATSRRRATLGRADHRRPADGVERARGFVPGSIAVSPAFEAPVLRAGRCSKTPSVSARRRCGVLGPHR